MLQQLQTELDENWKDATKYEFGRTPLVIVDCYKVKWFFFQSAYPYQFRYAWTRLCAALCFVKSTAYEKRCQRPFQSRSK